MSVHRLLKKNLKFRHLHHHPEACSRLAEWFRSEWPYCIGDQTLAETIKELEARRQEDVLPLTYLALDARNQVIGTISLDIDDMDTHTHLSPWIASLYVLPEYRNQGVGSWLLDNMKEKAKLLGKKELFLFTSSKEAWYSKMSWKKIEDTVYKNTPVVIMHLNISQL